MVENRTYCKAYLANDLRQFSGWSEKLENLRPEIQEVDGQEKRVERTELKDGDILYLQDDFTVTDDRFKGEHIIFDDLTDEWRAFCTAKLAFEVPVYEPVEMV